MPVSGAFRRTSGVRMATPAIASRACLTSFRDGNMLGCLLADIDMLNWDLVAAASGILVLIGLAVVRTLPPSGLRILRRWWLTMISIPLLAVCILWMAFGMSITFEDSM